MTNKKRVTAVLLSVLLSVSIFAETEFQKFVFDMRDVAYTKEQEIFSKLNEYHAAGCHYFDDELYKQLFELFDLEKELMDSAKPDIYKITN